MKDELVSYETAKLAKEKGFNIPVNNYFLFNIENTLVNVNDDKDFDNYNSNVWNYISQPTQNLLQRWLREIHRIFVYIIPSYTVNEHYMIEIQYGTKLKTSPTGLTEKSYFSTWEEALEEGLKQALLLL